MHGIILKKKKNNTVFDNFWRRYVGASKFEHDYSLNTIYIFKIGISYYEIYPRVIYQ